MKNSDRTYLPFIEDLFLPLKYFLAFSANSSRRGGGLGGRWRGRGRGFRLGIFLGMFLCTTEDLFMHAYQAEVRICKVRIFFISLFRIFLFLLSSFMF